MDVKALRRYVSGHTLEIRSTGQDVVIAISVESDGESFDTADDGSGWLSSLIGLRADLASGDERALYVGWLLDVQCGEIDDDAVEPSRPEGLGNLSPALESLVEIIGLERDLVTAAAEGAPPPARPSSTRDVNRWLTGRDAAEHTALLARVACGDGRVGAELMRRFRQHTPRRAPLLPLRTAGALRARAEAIAERRREAVREREARSRAEREREEQAARDRCLAVLAKREGQAWQWVDTLIRTRLPGNYDAAVALLADLRDVSGRKKGRHAEFTQRIRTLRQAHATKPSLLARLMRAGLSPLPVPPELVRRKNRLGFELCQSAATH
ncbi:MAG: hypothetical protein ABI818_08240 [Acidobacteriota bacterium]